MQRILTVVMLTLIWGSHIAAAAPIDDAHFAIRQGQYDQAITLLENLLATEEDTEAHYLLGNCLLKLCNKTNREAEAMVHLRAAAERGHARAQFLVGRILIDRGQTDEATHWLEQSANQGLRSAQRLLKKAQSASRQMHNSDLCQNLEHDLDASLTKLANQSVALSEQESLCLTKVISKEDFPSLEHLRLNQSAQNDKGQSPMHIAVNRGDSVLLNWLLAKGVIVDLADKQGNTALHYAIRLDDFASSKRLLAAGANPNQTNNSGKTPFDLTKNNAQLRKLLITHGAKPKIQDTPKAGQHTELWQSNKIITIKESPYYGWPTLNMAAWLGNTEAVKALLVTQDNLLARDSDGYNALQRAICGNQITVAHLLLKSDLDWPWTIEDADRTLHCKLSQQSLAITLKLIPHSIKNHYAWDALIDDQHGYLKDPSTRAVILNDDDINASWRATYNTLQQSLTLQDPALFEALFQNHAELSQLDLDRLLYSAGQLCQIDSIGILVSSTGNPNYIDAASEDSLLTASIKSGCSLNVIDKILASTPVIDHQNAAGNTALIIAASNNQYEIMELLLQRGANPELRNHESHTALMMAAKYNQVDAARHLVKGGAKLRRRDREGNTALELAEKNHAEAAAAFLTSQQTNILAF